MTIVTEAGTVRSVSPSRKEYITYRKGMQVVTDAQQAYWDISLKMATAREEYQRVVSRNLPSMMAGIIPDEVIDSGLELQGAQAEWDAFAMAHDGETFKVFHPEWVAKVFSRPVEQWDL